MVGATAVGIYDMRTTPFSGVFPGVEIQATIIDNILRRNFIRTPPYSPIPELLIIVLLGLLMGVVLPQASAIWILGFALLLLQAYVISNYLVFSFLGIHLDLLYPVLEIILVSTGINVYSFLIEERARASLKKAFQSYVAPSVVEEIIKNPERLRLGGERRELTIFFCDVRGFTTLSESMEPEEVVSLLHDFLNPMSKIVVKHGGTIDKFMGDAIMALFGAPLNYPDHASRACRTALEMQTTLKTLSQEWESQNRPILKIGVGINTGEVSVGNMGSDTLFDYTAIGDNVNLASRLEGLNKIYDTEIIISNATAQALEPGFILRELDWVKVKGRRQPVAIFELLGQEPLDAELAEFLQVYHQGLQLYKERQWDECLDLFKKAMCLRPHDHHCQRYCSLAEKYRIDPPGPDWQGVSTMAHK
jgi:adenylate cyclase